jgi:hypothetical protein
LNEFTWFSRLAVWVGCIILLAQAIAGRAAGFMTFIGVLSLTLGFVLFIGALSWPGLLTLVSSLSVQYSITPSAIVAGERVLAPDPALEGYRYEVAVTPAISDVEAPVPIQAPLEVPPPRDITTFDVTAASPECGAMCLRCGAELIPGQISATCSICAGAHHASCWIENHFHCSRAGCPGVGNLVAPQPPADPGT